MTTNPADPEEIKLRSKVADLQIHISDCLIVGDLTGKEAAEAECRDIVGRIQDMRTKASAPEPAPRCDPDFAPGSFGCHEALHMASYFADAVHESLRDHPAIEANGEWREMADRAVTDLSNLYSAIGAACARPAPPNTPQVPTHESIIQWAKEKDKEAIRTGKALKWTELIPDFARVFGLAQPAHRAEPTDEAIDEWLGYWPESLLKHTTSYLTNLIRAAVAHFNPPPVPAGEAEITDGEIVGAFERIAADGDESGGSGPEDRSSIYPISLQQVVRFARALLEKKQPPTGGLNSIDRNGLEQEKPSEPARQTEITDEEIEFVWRGHGEQVVNSDQLRTFTVRQFAEAIRHLAKHSNTIPISDREILSMGYPLFQHVGEHSNNCAEIVAFARALLAKHSDTPTLSDKTLRELYELAHKNAPDQFVTDAKRVVGRSNT